jgi:hypothetical protein
MKLQSCRQTTDLQRARRELHLRTTRAFDLAIPSPGTLGRAMLHCDWRVNSLPSTNYVRLDCGCAFVKCRSNTNMMTSCFDSEFVVSASEVLDEGVATNDTAS